jgi:hypothetical protein
MWWKNFLLAASGPLANILAFQGNSPSVDVEDNFFHETGVLDTVLASGHGRAINRDAICGLLTECLHDVSSTIHMTLCLFALLLDFLFSFVFVLGNEIN